MRKAQLLVTAVLLVLLLAACAPKAAPAPTPGARAPAAPAPAAVAVPKAPPKEAWQEKWDAMVEAAKKEGKVVIYSSSAAETRIALQQAFKDKFDIDAEFVAGSSATIAAKVMAERRAGLRLGDLLMGSGSNVISSVKPAGFAQPIEVGDVLILPEFSDPKLWLGGGLRWQDPTTHLSLTFVRYELHFVARNTELVREGEIQSYKDLLNPKWKGEIIMADPALGGVAQRAYAMVGGYTMGWDWMRALVKQEPLIVKDFRLQAEWLARGKYAVSFGGRSDELYQFKKMGLPVDTVYMREGGGIVSGSGMITLLKDTLHPNAAKLFINWLLTKEGQTIFSRAGGNPSARLDVSDEGALYPRAAPDSKAPAGDTEEALLKAAEDLKIVKEILLPLLK